MPHPTGPKDPPPSTGRRAGRRFRGTVALAALGCWLGLPAAPAHPVTAASRASRASRVSGGFELAFLPEAGVPLDVRGVEPGGAESFTVSLTRRDGSGAAPALSVTGLPPEVLVRHPAALAAGAPATVVLAVEPWATDGVYPFEVVATGLGASASLAGTLVVGDLPNVTSLTPSSVAAGGVTRVVVRGRDLERARVRVVAAEPRARRSRRPRPRVRVVARAGGGGRMVVVVDARDPGVEGYYELVVSGPAGRAAAPLRVVPDRASPAWPGWDPPGPGPGSRSPHDGGPSQEPHGGGSSITVSAAPS